MTVAASQLELFDAWRVRERVSARARRLRVEVRPDGEVVLTIPRRVPRPAALAFLQRQQGWIERTRRRLLASAPPAPERWRWDGQDRLLFRGEPRILKLVGAAGRRATLELEPEALTLAVPARRLGDPPYLRRTLLGFVREEAKREGERLLVQEGQRLGLRHRRLSVRDPRTRWGSCGADGSIMLSLRLVLAPPEVFRYVVIHELCHRRWRGHGPRFWALVARQMPDFEQARAWLRENGHTLHAAAQI